MFANNATNRSASQIATPPGSKTAGWTKALPIALTLLACCLAGCRTNPIQYVRQGFKVGPNYQTPAAPVSEVWIDYRNPELITSQPSYWDWWRVFRDPHLELLTQTASQQNITLRQAGYRIQEARARRAVAVGNLFPQQQQVIGSYQRRQVTREIGVTGGGGGGIAGPRAFDIWTAGGTAAWEIDFWGSFRRAVISADAELDASVENYDDVMVMLLGDVAQTYMEIRITQQRIRYAEANVRSQTGSLDLAKVRKEGGAASQLDVAQAITNVAQTEATIPALQAQLRQAENRLCVLMGMPPQDLTSLLDREVVPIPSAPPQIAIGVPADLLRRRPDVRRAERLAAAQSERIGIAEADMYPAFTINGTLIWQASRLSNLFTPSAVAGNIGPSFTWNLLNYGRIWNATNAEEAVFMQRVAEYQTAVLNANREAEDALVGFLRAQEQARILRIGVAAAVESRDLTNDLYRGGRADFGRVFVAELFLTQQQDDLALAEGAIATNLVDLFRALGGGWQIRLEEPDGTYVLPQGNVPPEQLAPLPAPLPMDPMPAPEPAPEALPQP